MMMYRYGSRTGFLVVLVSSESVKDRIVVGPADMFEFILAAYRE